MAAFKLRLMEHDRQQIFTRGTPEEIPVEEEEELTLTEATVFDLFSAFKKVLEQKDFRKDMEIKITTLSVTERLRIILSQLNQSESITFEALFEDVQTKQEVP